MKPHNIYILFFALLISSCQGSQKRIYIDTDYTSEDVNMNNSEVSVSTLNNDNEIIVPFTEIDGIKSVATKVNGLGLEMLFDTGCSGTLISIAEANYMYQKGLLSKEDFLGNVQSTIADGSVTNNALINLKELIIDDKIICQNVQATVSQNASAPLLLGNEVLDRAASYTIDNKHKVIIFKLK